MKEIKEKDQEIPIANLKGTKRWVQAKRITNGDSLLKIRNELVEDGYMRIIEKVKLMYQQLDHSTIVFERDYRRDKSQGLFGMHTFITPHFYFNLECRLTFDFIIEYDFYNCPFEDAVSELMLGFPYNKAAIHTPQKPNCTKFHERVLNVQDPIYHIEIKPQTL
ncbi:hypothetical protein LJ707_16245 [Mucilaginibacter sp. UR6-1]|uniref:hypothetical protein n=1 Tax=Mucilaginibacter sp. UR6-1 TaxID=1435643 RepID=UPI001E3BA623|nr:hypothetical protein [Mucilaginibacter sp. UR6-1]MCC8410494.1 hypothetical protein [Mucilaginibacter sp. UR6-1]